VTVYPAHASGSDAILAYQQTAWIWCHPWMYHEPTACSERPDERDMVAIDVPLLGLGDKSSCPERVELPSQSCLRLYLFSNWYSGHGAAPLAMSVYSAIDSEPVQLLGSLRGLEARVASDLSGHCS
jgi:hypothetical protein